MHSVWQDLRYGLRGLRNRPGFAAMAMLTLALGIGAATTIFSVIENVLLDPFPYADTRSIVAFSIHDVNDSRPGGRSFFQPPEYLDYLEQNHVFSDAIGAAYVDVLYSSGDGTEQYDGAHITPNTFRFLGVPALLGRTTTEEDARPGAPPVFVMSHKMWLKRFSLDPSILNRTFVLNGVPMTLVGIMPPRFTKRAADLWIPIALERNNPELSQRYFSFQGRMKPGVTMRDVQADIAVISSRLAQQYPKNFPKKFTIQVDSYIDSVVGPFRKILFTMAAAVGLLLLIACANVANMLLARATAREKEMAVRSALGASRLMLIRQLLIESLLLAIGGAAAGCLLAYGGLAALVTAIPDGAIPREAVIRINVPVLLFSLGVAALTALLFGLAPALQAARDVVEPLKDAGKGVSGGFRRGRLRNSLVILEVAMSLVLLAGAGLLMRSFVALQNVDLGFNPDNILVARLPFPRGQYKTAAAKQQFFRPLMQRIQALPGVVAATEASTLPPYGGITSEIEAGGKLYTEKQRAIFQLVSEGYFPTLGLRLLNGRLLTEGEVNDARKVTVVNQTLVSRYFEGQDPIGRRIRIKELESERLRDQATTNPDFEIVGVVADAKNDGIRDPVRPELFIPYTVTGAFERGIMVRTAGDPLSMIQSVRRETWAVDRGVAVTLTGSLKDFLKSFSYAEPRFSLILLGVFASVGLLLVAMGVYSVIAYTVSRQTHEIGIRMALGAASGDVFGMVLRMGLRLIGIGAAAGLLAAFAATRLISAQIFGVAPHDPVTLGGVVAVVAGAGVAACYFPARRATRVDPMVALRYE
jgi:putative ABC transport system permease protein